ncbi:hypothetical protein B5M09_008068 [Aphanomyces astaci]|uniref:DDE-1 domain-containing protein n=1 Tax=Aphanomyces astaci TaxID=112090 RepID=A0A3R7VYY3_APHAT|nr:hypothetical protein B5M09_008068 [Aphanomyces astaci]
MVYNADQTGVNYEYLPAKTIHARGENTEWIKCGWKTKGRATAMLVADCTGKKYPLFIVLKTGASKIKDVVQENVRSDKPLARPCAATLHLDMSACRCCVDPTNEGETKKVLDQIDSASSENEHEQQSTFKLVAPTRATIVQ